MNTEATRVCDSTLHVLARQGKVKEIRDIKPPLEALLQRNEFQQTPLTVAILEKQRETVETLLEYGAAETVFVAGYLPNSVVCTLPQASQPPSSVFQHPPPLMDTDPILLSKLDDAVCAYIKSLAALKVKKAADEAALAAALGSSSGPNPITKTPFNFFPTKLKVLLLHPFPKKIYKQFFLF